MPVITNKTSGDIKIAVFGLNDMVAHNHFTLGAGKSYDEKHDRRLKMFLPDGRRQVFITKHGKFYHDATGEPGYHITDGYVWDKDFAKDYAKDKCIPKWAGDPNKLRFAISRSTLQGIVQSSAGAGASAASGMLVAACFGPAGAPAAFATAVATAVSLIVAWGVGVILDSIPADQDGIIFSVNIAEAVARTTATGWTFAMARQLVGMKDYKPLYNFCIQ